MHYPSSAANIKGVLFLSLSEARAEEQEGPPLMSSRGAPRSIVASFKCDLQVLRESSTGIMEEIFEASRMLESSELQMEAWESAIQEDLEQVESCLRRA